MSPLRHWSVLYSDFLADYCWVEDSWLMMLDSPFGCALDIHTGAYSPIFFEIPICYWTAWLSLFMVIEIVHRWMIIIRFFTSRLRHQISILGHTPLSLVRLCIDGWSLLFVYLTTSTSNIHTKAYSPLLDEIVFGQWYEDGWSLFVVRLMTLTSDLILRHISPFFLVSLRLRQWPTWFQIEY